jgi:dethiobiotin synthetase
MTSPVPPSSPGGRAGAQPRLLVAVAGTGTEVGKTWLASQLCVRLRAGGLSVAARKPAQSFSPASPGLRDSEVLAAATGESSAEVCPPSRCYPRAMAPPMAAASMGLAPLLLADLLGGIRWRPGTDVGVVELAGGVGSPQAVDADGAELLAELAPDGVVLVARPGLGTLSDVRLSAGALGAHRLLVFLNHFAPGPELHEANRRWLAEVWGLTVFVDVAELAGAVVGLSTSLGRGGVPRPLPEAPGG